MRVVKSQATFPSELAGPSQPPQTRLRSGAGQSTAAAAESFEPAARADGTTAAGTPTGRTGVVVVHGIGSQQPAETLLQWTAPLIEVLTAWRAEVDGDARRTFPGGDPDRPRDPVKAASIDFESPFPTVSLHIPETTIDGTTHPRREWLITEAWWASNVAPPSLATMINWLGPGGGAARVVDGILGNPTSGSLVFAARAILVPIVSVVAGLGLSLYGLFRSIAAIIPIKAIRDASILRQFDEFLIGWFGDVRILLFDPAQSANIRSGLAAAVQRLRERCDHVIVVAHSGGVMISYLTLTDPELAKATQVDKLITFGEGWNLALRLTPNDAGMADRLRRDITDVQPHLRWRDFHASHDPAPAGPLDLGQITPPCSGPSRVRSFRVWNRLSVLGDHGGYFDNDEEFTLPLLRELDVPDGWGETSRFYPADLDAPETPLDPDTAADPEPRIRRHRQRVAIRALWRQTIVGLTVATVALALAVAPDHLLRVGGDAAALVPRVPLVADLLDAVRGFGRGQLETLSFDLPLIPSIEGGQIARFVDWVGVGVLQAIVLMAGLYVVAARTRAFQAWPLASPLRRTLWLYEAALSVGVAAVIFWLVTLAGAHGDVLGAGFFEWTPGIVVTTATIAAAVLGTLAAQASRATVVSSTYAVVAVVLFLGASAATILAILRNPQLETAEMGYAVIWIVAGILLTAGNSRWANWDRAERRIAYGPIAAVPVDRRPVIASSVGFLTLAATLAALILAGPGVWIVYLGIAGAAAVGLGALLGARAWGTSANPVAQPDAVQSARGSV